MIDTLENLEPPDGAPPIDPDPFLTSLSDLEQEYIKLKAIAETAREYIETGTGTLYRELKHLVNTTEKI